MPVQQIITLLKAWMEQGRTGQVEINFREGQIRNYTVRESFLVEGDTKKCYTNDRRNCNKPNIGKGMIRNLTK